MKIIPHSHTHLHDNSFPWPSILSHLEQPSQFIPFIVTSFHCNIWKLLAWTGDCVTTSVMDQFIFILFMWLLLFSSHMTPFLWLILWFSCDSLSSDLYLVSHMTHYDVALLSVHCHVISLLFITMTQLLIVLCDLLFSWRPLSQWRLLFLWHHCSCLL